MIAHFCNSRLIFLGIKFPETSIIIEKIVSLYKDQLEAYGFTVDQVMKQLQLCKTNEDVVYISKSIEASVPEVPSGIGTLVADLMSELIEGNSSGKFDLPESDSNELHFIEVEWNRLTALSAA